MPPLCRFFKTPKGCLNTKCKFFHPQPGGRRRGAKRGHGEGLGGNFHSCEGAGPSKGRRVSAYGQYQKYGYDIYHNFEQVNSLHSDYNVQDDENYEANIENARRFEELNKNQQEIKKIENEKELKNNNLTNAENKIKKLNSDIELCMIDKEILRNELKCKNAKRTSEINVKEEEIKKLKECCESLENEKELRSIKVTNAEAQIKKLKSELEFSKIDMEISRDELKLIFSESNNLRRHIEEGNSNGNDLEEKHSDILTILKDANQTIEKLRKENKRLKDQNNSPMIEENKRFNISLENIKVKFDKRLKELEEQKQVEEKLKKTNEKIYEDKYSMKDDLQTQRPIYEILENTFECIKEDCEKRLKEKDEMLENERDSKKLIKNDLDDRKEIIKTLEEENKSILNCITESAEKLSQLQEELQNNQKNLEKSFQEVHLRDLTIQKLNDRKRLEKLIS